MAADSEPTQRGKTDGKAARSSFQFSIAAILILTAAIAVLIRFAPELLELADEAGFGDVLGEFIYCFVIIASFCTPYFILLGISFIARFRRYWMLAACLLLSSVSVLAGWLILVFGIGAPQRSPDAEWLEGVGDGLAWMVSVFMLIFLTCLASVILAVMVHVVRHRELKTLHSSPPHS